MFEEKVSPELAAEEINKWLDAKRISPRKRSQDGYAQAIDTLMDAIIYGTVSIKEDRTIVHELHVPLEGFFDVLEYKARITVLDVQKKTDPNAKSTDGQARVTATISALTGKSNGEVKKLDTEDNSIAQAVAIFFL
jgi:hypothetical protein